MLHPSSRIRSTCLHNLTHLSPYTLQAEGEDSIFFRNVGIPLKIRYYSSECRNLNNRFGYIRTGTGSRNYYLYSLNGEGQVGTVGESGASGGRSWWGSQGAGPGCELCRPFSTTDAAERRSSGVCRDALTPRQQADMSLTLRVKYFQLSVKCKGEKITKVDFRGKYRQPSCNSEFRSTYYIFPVSLIDSLLFNDAS